MVSYAARPIKLTLNPGDRIAKQPQTIEEKAKQLAVDAPDITGDYLRVPAYFIVKYPNGETKALHHIKDAKEISDVIRQMRFEEEDWPETSGEVKHWLNLPGLIIGSLFLLMTATLLVGIF